MKDLSKTKEDVVSLKDSSFTDSSATDNSLAHSPPAEPSGTSRIGGNNSKQNFRRVFHANESHTNLKTNNDLKVPFSGKFSPKSNWPKSVKENSPNLSFLPKSFPGSFGENATLKEKSPNRSLLPGSSSSNFGESSLPKVRSPNLPFSPKSLVSSDYNYDRNSSLNTTESWPKCDFENTSLSISLDDQNSFIDAAVPFQRNDVESGVTSLEGVTTFCPAAESSPLHSVDFDKTGSSETFVDAPHSNVSKSLSNSSAKNLSDISLDLDNLSNDDDSVTNFDSSINDSRHSLSTYNTDKSCRQAKKGSYDTSTNANDSVDRNESSNASLDSEENADKSDRSFDSVDKNDFSQETVEIVSDESVESFDKDDSDPDFVFDSNQTLSSVNMSSLDTIGTVASKNQTF